ncbi:phytoene desaturase family protein [Fimbriimonas ginsengisoli]|uniref:4,4'-diaponeurosporene oxygenase n=1 Tax=Fimbriimonas ginsengisoli Gsoil 348 TaxID=661478 RepID=A0A068NU99_FIMGI|nr:phytoene desaturase family protein [Fimbriimonas ginsengisoli]AIE86942.1 phytoene desaturase [Fimbriimonas ginsengisoli Gsoil 348]
MRKQVVVVGGGQGGLSAAIYARLRGHDVMLLERSGVLGGKAAGIELSGYRLDPGPSIVILPRIYEQVFQDAGRNMADYLRFQRLDPISRVCFEGQPALDLPAGRAEIERLVREIAPGDAPNFTRLMANLDHVTPHIDRSIFAHPYDRPWQLADPHLVAFAMRFDLRATYKELVDGWFQSPLLRAFFYGFPSYGGQTYDSKAPGALMIPYLMLQEGVFYPEGGVSAIPAAFERLARELGVEFRTSANVTKLKMDGPRLGGVHLESGEVVAADAVISNVDRSTTREWLGDIDRRPPSLSYFTVHLGVRRRLPGLRHHTLLIPSDFERGFETLYRHRQFPEPPIVYLNDTTSTDASTAHPGCTNLFAVVTSPAEEDHLDWAGDYRSRVIATLARFGIVIDEAEIDFERTQTPTYFREMHGNYRGSLYGVDEKSRLFGGLFPLRNRDEQIDNLFYCGGSVQPGAGLPMVTLSGRFAASYL